MLQTDDTTVDKCDAEAMDNSGVVAIWNLLVEPVFSLYCLCLAYTIFGPHTFDRAYLSNRNSVSSLQRDSPVFWAAGHCS